MYALSSSWVLTPPCWHTCSSSWNSDTSTWVGRLAAPYWCPTRACSTTKWPQKEQQNEEEWLLNRLVHTFSWVYEFIKLEKWRIYLVLLCLQEELFTSKNGPAELSLHSLISCCLVNSSGQRLGSLDSNGSITCKDPHTETQRKNNLDQRWTRIEAGHHKRSPDDSSPSSGSMINHVLPPTNYICCSLKTYHSIWWLKYSEVNKHPHAHTYMREQKH